MIRKSSARAGQGRPGGRRSLPKQAPPPRRTPYAPDSRAILATVVRLRCISVAMSRSDLPAARRGIIRSPKQMSDARDLKRRFEQAMYEQVYERVWHECGYRAERFRQMICPPKPGQTGTLYRGGLATAKTLLAKKSAGFEVLDKKNRLDLSVEALVVKPEWAPLFTGEELRLALLRLEERKRVASRPSS